MCGDMIGRRIAARQPPSHRSTGTSESIALMSGGKWCSGDPLRIFCPRFFHVEEIGGLEIPLRSLWSTLHCRWVARVSQLLSIGWWYLSLVPPKRHCCRVSDADKGCWVYPLDPRPDAVALFSGCTPKARKLIVPQLTQTYAQAAKSSTINNSTQTDENITKIKYPPLKLLQPLSSLPKPNTSKSTPAVSTSSSSTEAPLLPSASSIAGTVSQQLTPVSDAVLSATNNIFTHIEPSSSIISASPFTSDVLIPKNIQQNSKNRRNCRKLQKPEIEIKMAPHKRRKSVSIDYTTDGEDLIMYDVEELEPDSTDKFVIKERPTNFLKGYLRALKLQPDTGKYFSSIVRDFLELFYNLWRTVLAKNKIVLDPLFGFNHFEPPKTQQLVSEMGLNANNKSDGGPVPDSSRKIDRQHECQYGRNEIGLDRQHESQHGRNEIGVDRQHECQYGRNEIGLDRQHECQHGRNEIS
ncbi:uncharacterized protein TNCV_2791691 [Trichonephila clavipes]|nr:uncharacterized protein TNCV_2791691 [Trichonephila clavipes]